MLPCRSQVRSAMVGRHQRVLTAPVSKAKALLLTKEGYALRMHQVNKYRKIMPLQFLQLMENSTQKKFSKDFVIQKFVIIYMINQQRSSGCPKDCQAKPHTHIGYRKLMNLFSHGYHGQQYCLRACMHNGDSSGVTQDGSHTPANRLTETCILGLQHPLILDIHVIVN